MTPGRPARPAGEKAGVITTADQNRAGRGLLLEMAFQAQRGVALGEHSLIHRPMRLMTGETALAQRLVLKHVRPALHGVALKTGFVRTRQFGAAALDRRSFVRVVAISATHFPLQHRMMVRQSELSAHLEMALETRLRRSTRVDDGVRPAAALHMQAAGPMTRFAADILRVVAFCFQARVRRHGEIARDRLVTGAAFFRANELSSGNARRRHERARRAAGKEDKRDRRRRARQPEPVRTITSELPGRT